MNKFLIKIFVFLLIIICAQTFIWKTYLHYVPGSFGQLQEFKNKKYDVIYFGDSTLHYVSMQETNRTPLFQMVTDKLNPLEVGVLMHDSYQADIELAYSRKIVKIGFQPKFIIVPINLRSFTPEWNTRPGFQFADEMVYLKYSQTPFEMFLPFFENFEVPEIDAQDLKRYQSALVFNGDKVIGIAPEYEDTSKIDSYDERMARLTTYHYMQRLHESHRRVQSLLKIARLFKNTKTRVIFYITPVDIQSGNKYIGRQFQLQMAENSKLLVSLLSREAKIIDLSSSLAPKDFMWKDEGWYMDEHMRESGRRFVADKIAQALGKY